MVVLPRAKHSGVIPLHSDLRARGAFGGLSSKNNRLNNPDSPFLSFTNICGLNSNLDAVHHHLQSLRPSLFLLTETQVSPNTSHNHLQFPGYELFSSFRLHGGVCAYLRHDVSCIRASHLESGPDTLWLKVTLKSSTKFICCVYRSPNDNSFREFFESLSGKIDTILSNYPSSEVIVLGDFNVHNKEWLGSAKTDPQGRVAEAFALSNDVTNIIHEPKYFPRAPGLSPSLLDLFLTTNPDVYKP